MIPTEYLLRGLGVVYFIAFFSLWRELFALYGSDGIVPVKETLTLLKNARYNFWKLPTIFWISASNTFLQGVVIAGLSLSVMVMFNFLTPFCLFFLWLFYLSFVHVGAPFMNFQWDYLLVEVGFYAFLFSLTPDLEAPMTYVFWILLFRLMFSSMSVKLQAYTPYWRKLTAMDYHYESQPLPNILAYFMHHQGKWFAQFSCIAVFLIEGLAPFLIFMGEEARIYAFIILVLFQWLILLTGNYAFFNILTLLLCLTLLFTSFPPTEPIFWAIGGVFFLLNLLSIVKLFYNISFISKIFNFLGNWGLLNPYGLFANMTKGRYEIIIEGSDDEESWKEYEFFIKPQDLKTPPCQIAPLQPRLEWQLWFIPSVPWNHVGWFKNFLVKVLEGSPSVLSLFKYNPFKGSPPKYVRAMIYSYKFTDLKTWKGSGTYWERTFVGVYTPPINLRDKTS